jgi:hypothetical protein
MGIDFLSAARRDLRGTDSNSLLRLYDQANEISTKGPSLMERTKANKALTRIAKELQKRNVAL